MQVKVIYSVASKVEVEVETHKTKWQRVALKDIIENHKEKSHKLADMQNSNVFRPG